MGLGLGLVQIMGPCLSGGAGFALPRARQEGVKLGLLCLSPRTRRHRGNGSLESP